jgi:CheY-like chemotaxis protein
MRILILDDQPGLAHLMALNLRARGYAAREFTSAREALLAIHECDVLVTDYHMPEMTGLEVARRAYAQGWRGSLLLMSAQVGTIREVIEHPLLHFILDKPFSAQTLIEALPRPK